MMKRLVTLAAGAGAALALIVSAGTSAQSTVSGPTVSLERYEVSPGDAIIVTMTGFNAPGVTISVCGNEARRGSVDCNMPESEGRGIRQDGNPTLASLPISSPPAPCPCVVRVSTATNDQVAVVPITLIGHPTAPVVNPDIPERVPLDVSIVANESNDGFSEVARASLGGASNYDVTVSVRNRSTSPVENFNVAASAGRNIDDELVTLELEVPDSLQAGETWQQTLSAEIPALTFGEVEWQATASGAGPTATATDTTRSIPWLLWTLVAILVVDLLILLIRFVMRLVRHGRSEPDENPFIDAPYVSPDGDTEADVVDSQRERQLVG